MGITEQDLIDLGFEKNGEWYVEFFEVEDDVRFTDRDHLSSLMDAIELARTWVLVIIRVSSQKMVYCAK